MTVEERARECVLEMRSDNSKPVQAIIERYLRDQIKDCAKIAASLGESLNKVAALTAMEKTNLGGAKYTARRIEEQIRALAEPEEKESEGKR
jgi:hypothetical protein